MQTIPQSLEGLQNRFKEIIYQVCPTFVIDEYNKDILNQIYLYAIGKGKLDKNKGIFFYGEVGTGKSTLMKILAEFQRTIGNGFKCVNCSTQASQYASFGIEALNESTYNEGLKGINPIERGFDELGREPNPAKNFGNQLNVMQYVFQIRYEMKVKTHVTTNMEPQSIKHLYGEYISDRAVEMFNFIEVTRNKSLRK